jgi:integrase
MKIEDLKKLVKGANQLHKMKVSIKPNANDKNIVMLWLYQNYERMSTRLPSLRIGNKTTAEETEIVRKAIEMRNAMEAEGDDSAMSKSDRKIPASVVMEEWIGHYIESGRKNIRLAKTKWLEANGDMPVGSVTRRTIIKMMDMMRKENCHSNYIRSITSRIRAFCNWAEQRGYMARVDTRKLLPAEQFGEVKALNEEELRLLAATPCDKCPDVKDLFMLGVYTCQRTGEMMEYTFSMLYNEKIKVRQGKTGKFIVIPLSEAALAIMQGLKERREKEGKKTGEKDKMFSFPSGVQMRRVFKRWLEESGVGKDRVQLHNSRSTAITLLIKKGVSESVTQELANHANPAITARYYRQIDTEQKKEALDKIPAF